MKASMSDFPSDNKERNKIGRMMFPSFPLTSRSIESIVARVEEHFCLIRSFKSSTVVIARSHLMLKIRSLPSECRVTQTALTDDDEDIRSSGG